MSGWGLFPWGLGPWGGASGAISIAAALATSEVTLRVTLSAEPAHVSGFAPGDALNPQTWVVTRLDTGEAFTIIGVRVYDPPNDFEIRVLEHFGRHGVSHRVRSDVLVSATGALISAPKFADFDGVIATDAKDPSAIALRQGAAQQDLANPPFAGPTGVGGAWIMKGGDYALDSGVDLLRKLIIRRLITLPGEFFHLPTYGVGLRIKEPLPSQDLVKLREQIERQIALEPEVASAQARVTLAPDNVLTIEMAIVIKKTGQAIEVGLRVPGDT